MASPFLQQTRSSGQPNLIPALGYGSRPRPASQTTFWLVSAAVFFYCGMLPILWRHAVNIIPSIAWTGIATVLLCVAAFNARHSSISLPKVSVLVMVFCVAYPLFGWISYQVWGYSSSLREAMLLQAVLIMLLAAALYLVGAAARSHRSYQAIWAAWGITACYVILNANNMDTESLYQSRLESGVRLNYQLMGDAFAICSVILATRIRNASTQWLFIGVSVVLMFLIPSRSAAFFGVCSLFATLLLFGGAGTRLLLISLAICALLGQQTGLFAELFTGTRYESAFTPDSSDNSWDSRQEVMDFGLAVLANQPFTGEWAFQLTDLKFSGSYIHNALDIWAQTGIVPFLMFIAIWVLLLMALLRAWERWPRLAKEAAPVLLFAALSWILSRNIANVVLFFCLGFASATLAQARFGSGARPRY